MAKILLMTKDGIGNWHSLRLLEEGHSVDICMQDLECEGVLAGLAPPLLQEEPKFQDYDLVIFDCTGQPELAEEARQHTPTLGDSEIASKLEDDRLYGIEVMEEVGINVPAYEYFTKVEKAKAFIEETGKCYVFKPCTPPGDEQPTATTYVAHSPEDMLAYIDKVFELSGGCPFILQEVIKGTEVSINGYFNGEDFFFISSTLEEKKFMSGGVGPNTGCSGNIIIPFHHKPKLYTEGLVKMIPFLKKTGFVGPIDLNTIVTDTTIYGLEWTPRFGYDSTATENLLIASNLGDFLKSIASGDTPEYEIRGKFSAAVRFTIPPYPSELEGKHLSDVVIKGLNPEEIARNCFLYDACLKDDVLQTVGLNSFIGAVVYTGESIEAAFGHCWKKLEKIELPDMQYRDDLCKSIQKRYDKLCTQGWFD